MNIKTSQDLPPIPMRSRDWHAIDADTYDGAPDAGPQIIGRGATEAEAIADLLEQMDVCTHGASRPWGSGKRECLDCGHIWIPDLD